MVDKSAFLLYDSAFQSSAAAHINFQHNREIMLYIYHSHSHFRLKFLVCFTIFTLQLSKEALPGETKGEVYTKKDNNKERHLKEGWNSWSIY